MGMFDLALKPLPVWHRKLLERAALVVFTKDQLGCLLYLVLSEQFF